MRRREYLAITYTYLDARLHSRLRHIRAPWANDQRLMIGQRLGTGLAWIYDIINASSDNMQLSLFDALWHNKYRL